MFKLIVYTPKRVGSNEIEIAGIYECHERETLRDLTAEWVESGMAVKLVQQGKNAAGEWRTFRTIDAFAAYKNTADNPRTDARWSLPNGREVGIAEAARYFVNGSGLVA